VDFDVQTASDVGSRAAASRATPHNKERPDLPTVLTLWRRFPAVVRAVLTGLVGLGAN
jgi:hypothetical protein